MTIDEAVNLLTVKHLENKEKKWIRDPVAYTLHEVWKIADSKVTYHPSEKVTTNADRIRAMSDEELARLMFERMRCPECPVEPEKCKYMYDACEGACLNWLQSPAEEVE